VPGYAQALEIMSRSSAPQRRSDLRRAARLIVVSTRAFRLLSPLPQTPCPLRGEVSVSAEMMVQELLDQPGQGPQLVSSRTLSRFLRARRQAKFAPDRRTDLGTSRLSASRSRRASSESCSVAGMLRDCIPAALARGEPPGAVRASGRRVRAGSTAPHGYASCGPTRVSCPLDDA